MKTSLLLISYFWDYLNRTFFEFKSIYLKKIIIPLTFIILIFSSPLKSISQGTYNTQTGTIGTTYSWIDCSSGTRICQGDDVRSSFNWPFDFSFYGSSYTTTDVISASSNGFIRLDGTSTTSYTTARNYNLTSTATNLGQIIAVALYDGNPRSGWIRYLTTGTAPNRILTVEYHNYEIDYNDRKYCNAEASFYETSNKVVLKLGTDNITKSGADMGIHSGVSGYYHKWQEIRSGTNNSWIEYSAPIQVSSSVGLASGFYSNLKAAFDKINDGTHKGDISIKINASTIETSSAVLNASGSGNANYNYVNIYPDASGLSITGNINAPLIDLNGADNVTIDGRVNGTGTSPDLSIINQSIASVSNTSAIRFINDAQNNTVKYCNIKGSQSTASSGMLFFSTTTASGGNSNNTINNNNITTYDNANRPVNTIYSKGTSGKDNSANTIKDNNIYDFIKHSSASNGIYIYSNSTDWTIDGNSFYETASFSSTGTVTYCAIKINNTLGNNFNIINNWIGGSDVHCASSPWTKTNTRSNTFNGIYLNVGATSATSVQNNTIKNFSWSNSSSGKWSGIYVNKGAVNIGTISGNTIGDTTGTASIDLSNSSTTSSGTSYGVYVNSTNLVNIYNNMIGSIKTTSSGSISYSFTAICKAGNILGDVNISDNFIGSLGTPNSIQAATANTNSSAQKVYGIYSGGTGNILINENTISNLFCAYNYATATSGQAVGIYVSKGVNEITDNTITNISSTSPSSSGYGNAAVIGICQKSTSSGQTVTGNNITNLHSTYTGTRAVSVTGIYYYGGTNGVNTISNNYINNLTLASTAPYTSPATIGGIRVRAGANLISNNIISLGENNTTIQRIYGIWENGNSGHNNDIFFNTVYIGGTTSGNIASSYAFYNVTNNNARDIRNNIFSNTRSGGSNGNHYAIRISGTSNLTIDNNDYYVSGTGGILGKIGNTNKADLTAWSAGTSQDANSDNVDPVFLNAGGSLPDNYKSSISLVGANATGVTDDYEGVIRNNPPKMGAYETTDDFIWTGATSTDFATATNWQDGNVAPSGASISFSANPTRDCYLAQNIKIRNITNTSSRKLNVNGKELTLTGDIVSSTANQIDASSSNSEIIFKGNAQQSIPNNVFVSSTIDKLTLDNTHGLVQNGNLIINSDYTLTSGNYTIGANTLTLNGPISSTAGLMIGGGSSNITIGGTGSATLPSVSLNNLSINRSTGIELGGDVDIDGLLTLTSGTLTIGANTLTISGSAPSAGSGTIDASDTAATLVFDNSSAITLPSSLFSTALNNLSISGAGITAGSDFTINNTLNLVSANPSSSKGLLDMGSYKLKMGVNSTNAGIGDVSGIVRREHTFSQNTLYTFGSTCTNVSFLDANLKPSWIEIKIELGSTPSWTFNPTTPVGQVQRVYKVACSNNSSTSQSVVNMRYLTSELDATDNDETKLVFWHKFVNYNSGNPHEHGKSDQNLNNHCLSVTGLTFGVAASTNLDDSQVGLAYSVTTKNTWKGEVAGSETVWENAQNWTKGTVPTSTDDVLIPTGLAHYPSLTASSNATVGTMEIEAGASIHANSYDLTVHGAAGAWINNGTFYPGTGTVVFDHGVSSEIVTIAGTTDFYNINIGANTTFAPVAGCTIRISGAANQTPTSTTDWSAVDNTVEWNGGNQTIGNPQGLGANAGYYNLILSGSGVKTMPSSALSIMDEFQIKGSCSVTAAAPLTVGGELEIHSGATFSTGNFDHLVGGHFDNSGTFNAASGYKITLNGSSPQSIYGNSISVFENLTIDNTSGINVLDDFVVNNTLDLKNGTVNVGSATLTLNGSVTRTAGNFNFNGLSSLIMGGTTAQNFTSNFFSTDPSFANLTINRTGGVIIDRDASVSDTLNLQSSNPASGTIGALDMGSNTLSMGATAITIGDGDLTGIVKRTTILPNVEYSFGHKYNTITFLNYGTLPTEISLKIEIGTAPTWRSSAVKRIYDLKQQGASGTLAVIKGHYLDSDLNGNNEQSLIDLTHDPINGVLERGRSNINTTDNWITLDNTNFGNVPSSFSIMELGFGVATTSTITWTGANSTSWTEPTNWTPALAPSSSLNVIIPDASTTNNDPTLPASSSIKTLTIQTNGVLNSGASSELTIVGDGGAWFNSGTFNPSTGKVIFNHGVASNIVTIAGSTDFYNIEVGENTTLQPVAGCYLSIAGAGTAHSTSVIDFSDANNTVEWKGGSQTIVNPMGIGGNDGYYNLKISGSGTKTLPTDALEVAGDLTVSGTTTAIAVDSIIVAGDISVASGSTFGTGSSVVQLGGDFNNQGTFSAGSNGEVYLLSDGPSQTISGSSAITFDNLRLRNSNGISFNTDVNVNGKMSFCDGSINVGANTLSINGTIYNPAGNLNLSSSSNLTFGGTSAIAIPNNLFGGTSSFNNLTINRSGGVTLGNEDITVNGTLNLTSGTLAIGANSLSLAGNSPTRTSGNIDASNASAYIIFDNSTSITLPASLFTGHINNLTLSGTGGVISNDDLYINGILNLDAQNPSSSIGILNMNTTTLDMGINATTIGSGDVTGIVRRQHTFTDGVDYSFGNEYTTINFLGVSGGVKPSWISCKIELGTAPVWRSTNVKRVYSFAQSAGGNDRTYTKLHYLDSELNASETDESQLTIWNDYDGLATGNNTFVNGKTTSNSSNNWVELIGMATDFIAPSTSFAKQYGIGYSNVTTITWTGLGSSSYPGDWSLPGHWSGGVPTAEDDVLIPSTLDPASCGYPDNNALNNNSPAVAKTITIEPGAEIDASTFDITVYGDGNAWVNNGTFTAGSQVVTFDNGNPTNTVAISGSVQFNNLVISDKTKFVPAANASVSIKGNLSCDGEFSAANSNTVIFNSSTSSQSITGNGVISFKNLTVNNTSGSGELNIESEVTVSDALTLTHGNITTDDVNTLTLGANATVSGGSASSFVDGPLIKEGTSSFVFPVGDNGKYARIGITNPTGSFVAQYHKTVNPNASASVGGNITKVSQVEYWDLEPVSTGEVDDVTLYFEDASASGITDPTKLSVAHWTGTIWEDLDLAASGSNYIKSAYSPTSFSPFTFGTTDNVTNPLPIELISFESSCDDEHVVLSWKTATEKNNAAFEVERSTDGIEWLTIGTLKGAGNSNTVKLYEFTDFNPNNDDNYYRLKQIDYDGIFGYSKVIKSECSSNNDYNVNLFPIPAKDIFNLEVGKELVGSEFTISNYSGQFLISGIISSESSKINIKKLPAGIYLIIIKTENGNEYKKKLEVN